MIPDLLTKPVVGFIQPPGTTITSTMRNTTGKTLEGSETEFTLATASKAISVVLNEDYYKTGPGMVASAINETNEMSGSKSLIMPLTLSSTSKMVSPVIDLKRMSFLAIANRINSIDSSADVYPTTIYDPPTDPEGDDHDAIYITKKVALDNFIFFTYRNYSIHNFVFFMIITIYFEI